jgi:uncharacterized protein
VRAPKALKAREVAHLLTSDLLVTRISRGKIKPEYAAFDSENLELARLLIETFEQHVGKTYGDLLAELEGYEEMNYRFIRGLSQLLGRRAVIETDSVVDPSAAREAVFEACSGMALSAAEKKDTLKKAAKKFSISIPELEKALWADLEENQVLKSFLPLSPAELLRQYNLSLTQTLLFRAVDLDIWVKGDFQKILWKILRSGLMYTLEDTGELTGKPIRKNRVDENSTGKNGEGVNREKEGVNHEKGGINSGRDGVNYIKEGIYSEKDETIYSKEGPSELKSIHLHLDGPASLFRMSERYGNSFAKLFPTLLRSKGWSLKAGILYKSYQGKRILEFILDDSEEAFELMPEAAGYPEAFLSGSQIEEEQEEYETGDEEIGKEETGNQKIGKERIGKEETGKENIGREETKSTEKKAVVPEIDTETEAYDSTLEKMFSSLSLGSWKIKREPTILKAGKYAFIPDFVLQRDGMKVYLEIVGFWTPEYLKKKVEKLKEVEEPVILLIDRKLKCSEKDFPAQEVIFFDRKIPANEVMQVLRKYEGQKLSEDLSKTQEMEIPLSGELVSLENIAAENGIMLDALKEVIADRLSKTRENGKSGEAKGSGEAEGPGEYIKPAEDGKSEKLGNYILLGNYMVHRRLLEKIGLELEKPGTVETYADAVNIFEGFGLDRSLYYPVLEQLEYKVIWTGLSEENARVRK